MGISRREAKRSVGYNRKGIGNNMEWCKDKFHAMYSLLVKVVVDID
jgi:hypothetical protein